MELDLKRILLDRAKEKEQQDEPKNWAQFDKWDTKME